MILKKGMYVRTHKGIVGKILDVKENTHKYPRQREYYQIDSQRGWCTLMSIDKANDNIADVLVAGDIAIMIAYGLPIFKEISQSDLLEIKLGNYQVYRVITKEQFESMAYKV